MLEGQVGTIVSAGIMSVSLALIGALVKPYIRWIDKRRAFVRLRDNKRIYEGATFGGIHLTDGSGTVLPKGSVITLQHGLIEYQFNEDSACGNYKAGGVMQWTLLEFEAICTPEFAA